MNDLTKEWLFFAKQDLRVAEMILEDNLSWARQVMTVVEQYVSQ